jgi:hypothetical protein
MDTFVVKTPAGCTGIAVVAGAVIATTTLDGLAGAHTAIASVVFRARITVVT